MIHLERYNRWQAFFSHLAISFVIFLVLIGLIILIWYPGGLIKTGGIQGIKIVAGIDLVLGPLLTLIIFNPSKKSLKFDLVVIALIQTAALSYGVYAIHNEKPAAVILSHDGIHIITQGELANTLSLPGVEINESEIKGANGIYFGALELPNDMSEVQQLEAVHAFAGEQPLSHRIDLYRKTLTAEMNEFYKSIHDTDDSQQCFVAKAHSKHLEEGKACLSINKRFLQFIP